MPKSFHTKTEDIKTGCGNIHFIYPVDLVHIKEFSLQFRFGKTGTCTHSMTEAFARIITHIIRNGGDVIGVMDKLKGIRCEKPCLIQGGSHLSCADAIAKTVIRIMKEYKKDDKKEEK